MPANSAPLKEFGRHFIVGLAGPALLDRERELLGELSPLGVIIFSHNIAPTADWPEKLLALLDEARALAGRDFFFASIDHEGGRVHRLREPATHFPAAACWGEKVPNVSQAQAAELRALGFNLSFAPVLDVLSQPLNTVIGQRAFSTDPKTVAQAGLDTFHAMTREGLVACGKHFPGHGGTTADSHDELPQLASSRDRLDSCELLPFRALIAHGIPFLMTAHVLYPALDAQNPATLSEPIISGLLRSELGFRGAVISDALDMRALAHISRATIGPLFLRAGADVLLVAQPKDDLPLKVAHTMARSLAEALAQGTLAPAQLEHSAERIRSAVSYAKQIEKPLPALAVLGCAEHRALCASLTA